MMAISLLFIACEKHDMMDNDVIVGQMAPQVYWEPASSTVKAGENVPFMVQYWNYADIFLSVIMGFFRSF